MIVELKAAKALAAEHEAQILGYLKSARLEHGLLINFGSYKFEIRKFALGRKSAARNTEEFPALSSLRSLRSLRLNEALT